MIPGSVDINGEWKVLPPGVHDATLGEIEQRFATNARRKALFEGFKRGVEALRQAGCRQVYLDGSFVSDKPNPGDFDACWDPDGVDPDKLDPVLLQFAEGRKRQKVKYRGEFFPSSWRADGLLTFFKYFQRDKDTNEEKGIIRLRLQ